MQLESLFDVQPSNCSETRCSVHLPIEEREWNIGLIVGASGSGKSTIARELFAANLIDNLDWPEHQSIIDAFPGALSIKDITALLSSVGFASPPSWLRPYSALSTGEKFRAMVARSLAEFRDLAVIDEFTSVVDRTVAQIGSAAVAKTVRRRKQRLIAVSCHYDIIDWLQPDWIYEPGIDSFQWRELRCRPEIRMQICRVHSDAWNIFKQHHYLSAHLHRGSRCFAAFIGDRPAAFTAVLPFPHAKRPGYREHRTVCLPDFQGVGIGNALSEFVASLFRATGKPYFSSTSHPAMIRNRANSGKWRMTRPPGRTPAMLGRRSWNVARDRMSAGFEFIGPERAEEALGFGLKMQHEKRGDVVRITDEKSVLHIPGVRKARLRISLAQR